MVHPDRVESVRIISAQRRSTAARGLGVQLDKI